MKKLLIALWLFVSCIFCLPLSVSARDLNLVTAALPPIAPSEDQPGYMGRVASEAFSRIGVLVTVTTLPGERALINVNQGLDDGDVLRIPGLEKAYPNLVRIPEKVMDFEFVAFTGDENIRIRGFTDLGPYSVAYVTGWKFYEDMLQEAKEITTVRGLPELFALLKNGRADVVLAERWQGLWAAKQVGVKVNIQLPAFRVSDMYMYLNRRHAGLVPGVTQAIVDMKADGSLQRIFDETLRSIDP